MTSRILIVDSETANAEILWTALQCAGYEPLLALSIGKANHLIGQNQPDAILLRCRLPEGSGLSLLASLRARAVTSRLPVIALGEGGSKEEECIRALEAGADDYVSHPYGIREILARIRVVLRPVLYQTTSRRVSVDALTMDFDARRVFAHMGLDDPPVELHIRGTSYKLLRLFVENPYQVLSRKDIIHHVWHGARVKDGIVDVYIKSLREALTPLLGRLAIDTVRGHGFRLSTTADATTASATDRVPVTSSPPPKRASTNDRHRQPLLVADLDAAVEKIRHLQTLLQKRTEENRTLREEIRARKPD
jgi:two-component system phosphate regulon response regulator PhoB